MSFVLAATAATHPTAPVIGAAVLSQTQIQISIVTPSQEPVTGIIEYVLSYSTAGAGGPFTAFAVPTPGQFAYTWAGALAGTNYWMVAQGVDNSLDHVVSPYSAAVAVTTPAALAGVNFPLNYTDALGSVTNYTGATWQTAISANYNLVTISGIPNLGSAIGVSPASLMQTVKSKAATAGTAYFKMIQYQMEEDFFSNSGVSGFFNYALLALLTANPSWWLTSTYPTLTQVTGDTNHSVCQISDLCPTANVTSVGSVAGPGVVNLAQALAFLENNQYFLGKTGALNSSDSQASLDNVANSYTDGFQHDNTWMVQRYSGNWLYNSTTYNGGSPYSGTGTMLPSVAPHLWAGWKQLVVALRGYQPNILQFGNCDHLGWSGGTGTSATYDASAVGLWDYAQNEHTFNNGGVEFVPSTWTNLITACVKYEQLLRANGASYVVALVTGNGLAGTSNGNDNWQSKLQSSFTAYPTANNDWENWRYHFGMCQLLRWIAGIRNFDSSNIKIFDEQTGSGALGTQWLGAPSGARNLTTPWKAQGTYGIWMASFANGYSLINPRGNGVQAFNMPGSGHFLATTTNHGDSHYNTGAAFTSSTSITLQDRDSITVRNT